MRAILSILVLCFSFGGTASAGLVQSIDGGSASGGSGSGSFFTYHLPSSAAGFASPTTAGNFILCIAWAKFTTDDLSAIAPSITLATSGFSWTTLSDNFWGTGNPGSGGGVALFYIQNAASMNVTTVATFNLAVNANTDISNVSVEFSLYEFSGIATTSALDQGKVSTNSTGSATIVGTSNLATSTNDLVISAFQANPGSSLSNGSGYTGGISSSVVSVGQMQYIFNQPSGSISTVFGGTENYWTCVAAAFKLASVPPSAVLRHRGFVN